MNMRLSAAEGRSLLTFDPNLRDLFRPSLSLPGMSSEGTERITSGRPYSSASDLVSRRVISQQECDKIKDLVTAND